MVQNSAYSRAQSSSQRANNDYQRAVQNFNQLKAWRTNIINSCTETAYGGRDSYTCTGTYSNTTRCTRDDPTLGRVSVYNACMGGRLWGYDAKYNELSNNVQRAKGSRDRANSKLSSTPSQISKDNFTNYSFTTRTFEVTKKC